MKTSLKLLAALFLGSIAVTASAVPLVGTLGLTLEFGGTVTVDTDLNTVTFTGSPNSTVNIATGDYAFLGGDDANYANFNYSNPFAPMQIFSGAGFSFLLTSIGNVEEAPGGDGVFLQGIGTITVAGFDDTEGTWSFSSDKNVNSPLFNFSSTVTTPVSVPDGGTTALLIGLGLIGASLVARRNKVA